MVRANVGWGAGARAMVKRALQSAVLVAVGASVPAAWSAGRAPASFVAASTPNLHVKSVSLGSASFSSAGSVTTVLTGSARTIINYQYLSVPAGTTLDFTQPSSSSRVFNRIDGNMPSAIDGTIHSNGIVYLVNPAGIMFGNGAVIEVGKFYAAAAHMTDNDFATGNDHFTNVTGTVTNAGTISAGEVHLVGTQVANFGQILAGTPTGGGVVTMTAGKDVYIGTTDSPAGSPRIMVKVSAETGAVNPGTGVTNGGTISAGQIRLGAGDLYAAGIYNNGVLKGQAITLDSGASTNITAGTVDASSATGKGGTIELLGHQVGVTGGSVDASGATGGGTVLVGGAAHGGGGIAIAQDTVISSGATVRAEGTGTGASGGTVVAYSSEWTQVAGKLSAVGGTGGTGGFIETSSEGQLSIVEAPSAGVGGQWLMDPTDVTIGGGATGGGTFAGGVFTPGNNDTATVSASDIATALVAGTSVTINTSSADVNKTGNITSSSTITVVTTNATPSAPTLTLNALGAIALSGGISVSGPVAVNMAFNSAGTVGIGGNISTNGGSFTTNGASFSLAPATTLATAGGNIVLKNTAGVSISGTVTAGSGTIWSTGTSFTVVAGGSVSSTTAINILHTGNVVVDGPLSAGAGGAIAISGQSVDQSAAGVVTAGTLAVTASGDDGGGSAVLLNQASNVVGTIGVSATEASAAVSVQTNGALNLVTIPALAGVPTGLPAFGAVSGITTNAGAVTVAAGGTVSVSNPIAAAGQDVSITTTAGDINGVGANAIAARNVVLNAAGGIGILAPVVLTPSGNVLITTGGANAAGDASVDFTGVIATSKITTLTNTNGSQTGLTFSFLSNGAFTVDSAFGAAAENVTINAVGSAVVDSGGNTLTGAVLTVAAGTTVGAAGAPLLFSYGTSAAFTSGGNVFVSSGAYTNPLTFTTDATPRTIELSGAALTIGTNIAAGASNTLVVAGSTSVTVNAGETLSGSTVYVVSAGDIALAGNVSAGTTALFQGNSVAETTGTISAPTLGVATSGALAGVSINLTDANSIGTFAMSASGASGTVALRSTTDLVSGSVGAFSPSGVTAFGAITGTNGNGQNVVVSAAGNLTLTAGITSTGANVSLTANGTTSNLVENGGTVSAGNITVNVTGGVGTSGVPVQVATLGTLSVTTAGAGAAGDIFVVVGNALNASNLTVSTAGGQLVSVQSTGLFTVDAAVALAADDVAFSGTTLSVTTGNSVAAGNVTLATTAGAMALAGGVTAGAGDTVTVTAVGGGVNQTAGTISAPGGTITISGAGAVALGGTGVTATTGTVSVTATGGSGAISGGSITAGNLSLNAGTTITLTGDAVGTLAAVSSGTLTFGNSGGLTVGTVGVLSNVTSGGHDLALTDTTGAIVLTKLVTAGAGNATVHAATGITGNGTVSGNVVTLTADAGDIGTSGTHVNTSSTDLVLSGGNMFVNEANVIGTTAASRIAVTTTSGDTFNLTAPSIVVTTAFGKDAASPISLTTTTGAITASGAGAVTGSVVTLVSDAGIGTGGSAVPVTVGTSLALTGSGAGIFVSTAGTLDLGTTTVTDTAGQTVSLTAGNFSTSGAFSASGDNLVLTTLASGVLTIGHSVTASNVTLVVDDIAWSAGGALLTGASGTIVIGPVSTEAVAISPGVGAAAGTLRVDSGLLAASTAGNVSISSSTGQAITVGATGAVNLSAAAYNLTLTVPGGLVFNNLMTLPTGSTLTVVNAGGISDTTGTNTALAIPGGTLVIVNETGDIAGQPFLRVDIANLGNVSASGQLGLWNNNDDLAITGTVTANGTGSTVQIIADANITVTSTGSVHAPNEALALQSNSSGALTVSGNVSAAGEISLYSNGNVALDAGNVLTTGTVNLEANSGAVTQLSASGIQAGLVQASTASGISLAGTHNIFGQVSVENSSFGPPTTGAIVINDTGAVGQALVVNFLDQETTSGSVTLVATGPISQSSSLFIESGGTLTVQTRNASGAAITLTDAGNNLSGVATTLQVLDASGNPTVAANVSFSNSIGAMSIQQIQSGANVALVADAGITQAAGDSVGIHATSLTVTSDGATTLTNAHNDFSTLNVTDSSTGLLAYTTTASTNGSNALTISGFTQSGAGSSHITNSSGAISSTANLTASSMVLSAVKGISLTGANNSLTGVTANNSTSGNIVIDGGNGTPLVITSIAQLGTGNTSLTSGDGITINGNVSSGTSLGILVNVASGTYTSGAAANLTSGENITIVADQAVLTSGSAIQTPGTVTMEPFTGSEQVSLGGSGAGVLNLSNAGLNSIAAPLVTIGSTGQTGDVDAASGALRLPGNVLILTVGNVDLSAAAITSATGASLTVRHTGTLALGSATISGGLTETNLAGSGAGGAVTLSGPLTTADHAIVFNSPVVVSGATTSISTLGTTGADITFGFSGAASVTSASAGNALTLTAGTGNISFASPVGSAGVPLGLLTVVSANLVTLPTVHASGESLTTTGNLTVSGAQLLGTAGFVQTGAAHVNVGANISTQGNVSVPSGITLNSPLTLTANTMLDTTNAGASTGSAIALNGAVTGGAFNLTLHGGTTGALTAGAAITTTGTFTSTGAAFTNNATITAAGISLTQSGAVTIDGALAGGASAVSVTGVGITSASNGPISGATITLAGTTGAVGLNGTVTGTGLFTSNGATFTNHATITSIGANLTFSGAVAVDGALAGQAGNVSITGNGITSLSNGPISGATITLVGGAGGVGLSGNVTASGVFGASGATFTSNGTITSAGMNLTLTGPIVINGPLAEAGSDLSFSGTSFTSGANGTITARNVTVAVGTGAVDFGGTVTASGNVSSTGGTFLNTSGISGSTITLTQSGNATIQGTLAAGAGNLSITAPGVVNNATGTLTAGNITIAAASFGTTLNGAVNGSGLLTVTGASLLTEASVTSAGANVTVAGVALLGGPLVEGTHDVVVNSGSNQSTSMIVAGNVTLASGADLDVGGQITASGNVSTSGTTLEAGGISGLNITLNQSGLAALSGTLDANNGSGVIMITSAGLQQIGGIVQAGQLGLTGIGANAFTLADANQVGTLAANIPSGSLLFTNAGALVVGTAGSPAVTGITTAGPVTLTAGGDLTISQPVTAGSGVIQFTATGGTVAVNAATTTTGTFTSSGAAFTNSATITAGGITLTHSGLVTVDGTLAGGSSAVAISGNGIVSNANGMIGGGTITLAAGAGNSTLSGAVNGTGLFTSSGAAFTSTGGITSAGANITSTHLVTISGPLVDGSNPVSLTGVGISTGTGGTITAGTITLTANSGDLTLGGAITASGALSSSGANFTNTGSITSVGANLTQSGAVNIDGALAEGTSGVSISGVGITSNANGGITGGAITLAGGSGAVTLGGAVNGSGAFGSSGVAFTNSGTISAVGVSLTHTGAVTIENTIAGNGGAVSITGALSIADASSGISGTGVTLHASGLVDVGGTLGSGSGAATLTSDNSGVTVGGALTAGSATLAGATTVTVGSVTTSGGAVVLTGPSGVTLNGDVNAGTFGVSVNGPTTLGGNDTVTGGVVTFSGAVSGGGKSLTVDSAGVTTFGGSVGSSGSPLAALTTDAAGNTVLDGSVFTSGALAINDALTLGANSTISGGTVNFGGTISGGGLFSLAVNSTTSSAFAGMVGAGTGNALTTFTVGGGTATFTAPTITTSGGQTYSAGVVTSGTATLTGTTFSLSGPVTLGGPTTVSGTTFSVTGPVVFGGTTVLTGTSFSFTNTLNSGSSAADVTVAAAGPVAFGGVVGGGSPLKSLTVTGATETTLNHAITTTGNISVSGPIAISATLTSSGGGISLPGVVTLSGATAVTAGGAGGIVFGTGGTITGPESLTLTSNTAGAKTLVGALGTGTASNQRLGNVTFDSAGVVVLGGNIYATNLKFAYKDGGAAPTPSPVFATVYYAKGDLMINTLGTFDMEQNQTLTVFAAPASAAATFGTATGNGSLTIISNNHAITLGDVASQGVLTVDAGVNETISIHSRATEQVLQADGTTLESTATGIVSGLTSPNALVFTGSIAVLPFRGATTQVDFSSGAASADIADKTNLRLTDATKILDFNRPQALNGAQFFRAGVNGGVLQVVATGVGTPPQTQVNVVPRDVQTLEPERAAAISGALKDTLFQLGIAARDARTDELIEYLVGAALYDDVPYTLDTNADTKIASTRLPYGPVVPTVNRYLALFFKPEVDGNGKPVLDEKGKPKMVAQTTIITNTFGQMWGAYHTEFKGGAAAGFRGYLEAHQKANPKAGAALSYLNQVRDLLFQIKDLGLTSTEYERSEKILLGKVRPVTIRGDDFLAAILGPSTLTKNMRAMK